MYNHLEGIEVKLVVNPQKKNLNIPQKHYFVSKRYSYVSDHM